MVRVITLRRIAAVFVTGVVAAGLVFWAYSRLNLPPDARARRAIDRAEAARAATDDHPIPASWQGELNEAVSQLSAAQDAYVGEMWSDAEQLANEARQRFDALLGAGKHELIGVGQFFSIDGRVQTQRAGRAEWENAHLRMPVFNGDFVKSSRDSSAEIMFNDGSLYRIGPSSLLEIHHRDRVGAGEGTVNMVTGRINVYTSGSGSTVTTSSTRTEIERDSRVAVDVDEDERGTKVATFTGSARVSNPRGDAVVVGAQEMLAADEGGGFSAKQRLPSAPVPLRPHNNAAFDLDRRNVIELTWRSDESTDAIHLQVSRSSRFVADQIDVDAPALLGDRARLQPLASGTYFWRVASRGAEDVRSEWSSVRRFRIFSPSRQRLLQDREPPPLEIDTTQQLGHMFIVEGSTEVGATVTINGEAVDVDRDGRFQKTVEVRQEGWNVLEVTAVDPSGNESTRRERVFVEVF